MNAGYKRRAQTREGGGAAGIQTYPKLKFKKHVSFRHHDIKRFTLFALEPPLATEIG
jgi:hypothetical protein